MRLLKKYFNRENKFSLKETFQYGDDRGDLFFHGSDE